MKSEDLVAAVDFLYCGEANVNQENLDSFLAIATELQLKGLVESSAEKGKRDQEVHTATPPKLPTKITLDEKIATKLDLLKGNEVVASKAEDTKATKTIAIKVSVKEDLSQLDEQIQSLIEKSQSLMLNNQNKIFKAHVCKVCGKEGMKNDIKKHIESNHVEGVFLPCKLCEKTFRARNSLRIHNHRNH